MPFMTASSWETPIEQPKPSMAASSWENPFEQPNPFRHLSAEVDESWHWPPARAAVELAPDMGAAYRHLRWAGWPEDGEDWDSDPGIRYFDAEGRTWEEQAAVAEVLIRGNAERIG